MSINVYADASISWEHPQLNQGKATVIVAVVRELDARCIIASIPPRGKGQSEIVRNAEIDAILIAKNLLNATLIITDSRFARNSVRNKLDAKIQWASRKDLRIKIVDSLNKSNNRGIGYIVLNSPSPQRNWVQFVKEEDISMRFNPDLNSNNWYVDFVSSAQWTDCLEKIKNISPLVADAIGKYGIGEKIDQNQYDFESGQLLDSIPFSLKKELEEEIELCYEEICNLAKAYASFVVEIQE